MNHESGPRLSRLPTHLRVCPSRWYLMVLPMTNRSFTKIPAAIVLNNNKRPEKQPSNNRTASWLTHLAMKQINGKHLRDTSRLRKESKKILSKSSVKNKRTAGKQREKCFRCAHLKNPSTQISSKNKPFRTASCHNYTKCISPKTNQIRITTLFETSNNSQWPFIWYQCF